MEDHVGHSRSRKPRKMLEPTQIAAMRGYNGVDNGATKSLYARYTNLAGAAGSPLQASTRAEETSILLQTVLDQLIPFMSRADTERNIHSTGAALSKEGTSLIHPHALHPQTLRGLLEKTLTLSDAGTGYTGLRDTVKDVLTYSVNPTAPGFMDKLYSTPLPPGIAAELILAVLNANLHVYQVSPVLTTIEKHVTKKLAALFGLTGPRAGGISVTGGSASNLTSIVAARNCLYPQTKTQGNNAGGLQLLLFTSADSHYSIEKASQGLGFGSDATIFVPVDVEGRMIPSELERLIMEAKAAGKTPFYINATAGTTVLGAFDRFEEISQIARKHRCWMHVDGAWGGSFIFPQREDFRAKMKGVELADSIGINPHKMLGVPVTCSILLTRDLRLFEAAMTLKAGYLFHEAEEDDNVMLTNGLANDEAHESKDVDSGELHNAASMYDERDSEDVDWTEPNDLADMTLQCGRRGDSFKFFLSWQYYGTAGYAEKIQNAYEVAVHMSNIVDNHKDLTLVLGAGSKPTCLQVCFYYTPGGQFTFGLENEPGLIAHPYARTAKEIGKQNTKVTGRTSKALIMKGFMIDYSPALAGQADRGHFLRVVVNISTSRETVERLVADIVSTGEHVIEQLKEKYSHSTYNSGSSSDSA